MEIVITLLKFLGYYFIVFVACSAMVYIWKKCLSVEKVDFREISLIGFFIATMVILFTLSIFEPSKTKEVNQNSIKNEEKYGDLQDFDEDSKGTENDVCKATESTLKIVDGKEVIFNNITLTYNPNDPLNMFSDKELAKFPKKVLGEFFEEYLQKRGYCDFDYYAGEGPTGEIVLEVFPKKDFPCDVALFMQKSSQVIFNSYMMNEPCSLETWKEDKLEEKLKGDINSEKEIDY